MEISDAVAQNLVGFVSALIGGIVGGWFTLKATDKAIREANIKADLQEEKEIENMLDSLGVEVETLWEFHMRRIGPMLESLPKGKAIEFYYPLTQDYFTVYNTNAGKIGSVKDEVLRKAIVVCYNKCKKVVDGFKYNNELFRDWQDFDNIASPTPDIERARANKHAELVAYAQLVKEDHFELKEYIENMLSLLDKRGV